MKRRTPGREEGRPTLPILAALVVFATAASVQAQAVRRPAGPPSAQDVAAGGRLFQRHCVLCHGGDGTGGRGPDLTRGAFRRASTDEQLYGILQGDLWEAGMGWFGFNDTETWQVIAYLRSLGGSSKPVPGDPKRGRELFFGASACATCHMVAGQGGRTGPDLSWIGWRNSAVYLRTAIRDPGADLDPAWWRAAATTSRGEEVVGYLRQEDQFNVHILDDEGRLHALPRATLRSFERMKVSAMPATELEETDVTDLVAFLSGLRGGSGTP